MRNADHDDAHAGHDARDDDFDLESLPETEFDVVCPHCGETVSIIVDPWGGSDQTYTEDCEVCCQPWLVHVVFDPNGHPTVTIDPEG